LNWLISRFLKDIQIRGKWGVRGDGLLIDGEALFFKTPDAIKHASKGERALQLNKLAFIALIYNRFEYMQLCMNNAGFQKLENQHYLQLISAIEKVLKELPERPFPIFSDKFSAKASKARFENPSTSNSLGLRGNLRQIAMKSEPLKRVWNFLRRLKSFGKSFKSKGKKYWEFLVILYSVKIRKNLSELEQLLLQYQLHEQVDLLVKNRIIDTFILKHKANAVYQKMKK
jgi:hypothetical protein